VSARDPETILAELGHDLRAAWARPPRRARLARWPRGLVAILALLALVPTALATRDAIWAPDPVPLPDAARPPGSVARSAPARRSTSLRACSAEWRGG
jgi:heme A synthase